MKLPMPTTQEIAQIADRAEHAIYMCDANRTATKLLVENAIRHALQVVTDRLDIQVASPLRVDLSKP
jgi:LytS/YehU family sensor histidine kinase